MIATKDSLEPQSSERLPNSDRIYVNGELHADVRVPFREIKLSDTKTFDGRVEANAPVRVYDCSGPWGDPAFSGDVTQGLPRLRENGSTDAVTWRNTTGARSNRWTMVICRATTRICEPGGTEPVVAISGAEAPAVAGVEGHPVTQLWYARQGMITPEMEFIAIRENMGRKAAMELVENKAGDRRVLNQQHPGNRGVRRFRSISRRSL